MFQQITSLFKKQQGGGIHSRIIKINYQKASKAIALFSCVSFFVLLPMGFSGVSKAEAAIFYQNNFDSETTGTLPTGWSNIGTATWAIGTTGSISGAKALSDSNISGISIYTGEAAQADSAGQISQVITLGSSGGANTGLFLRVSSDGNNGYLFAPDFSPSGIVLFKKVNGTYTQLNSTSMGRTWSNGDVAILKAEAQGTTLRWKVWKSTESEPGFWTYSTTDSSVSAAGYIGIYEGRNWDGASDSISSVDDIYWGDIGSVFASSSADSFTVTGPTSGSVNSPSTSFTVMPNGLYSGTITPVSTGAGTFSPTSLSWSSSANSQTFTYVPTSTSGSPHVISLSSDPTITNSSGSISYAIVNAFSVDNAAWAAGRSPYNWYVSGSSYAQAVNPGAYFKVKFDGTSVSLGVDVSAISAAGIASKKYPRIAYQIDGGAWQTYQLLSTDTQISLGSSLVDTIHDLEVVFLSSDAYTARWNGTMSLKITSLILDPGKTLSVANLQSHRLLAFGDSITEGAWISGNHDDLTNYSNYGVATSAYIAGVANDLNAEYGNTAFGGQAWGSTFNGDVPSLPSAWNYYFGTNSRLSSGLFSPAPDYIIVNMGTNGGASSGTVVSDWLTSLRAAAGLSAKIFVIIPFNGTGRANITSGFNSYKSSSSDQNVFLMDLGSDGVTYSTQTPTYAYDGLHPNTDGHAQLRALVTAAVRSEVDTTPPNNIAISAINADSPTQLSVTAQTAADSESGLHSSPYWFNELSGNSGALSSTAWQASVSFVNPNLFPNTQYSYCIKARDADNNESSYSPTLSKYTLAPIPTNFSATSNQTSVNLLVNSFSNSATALSGYYFSRTGANSGWIQTNSWQDANLSCGASYTYYVKYRNAEGIETVPISLTKSTVACGNVFTPPVKPIIASTDPVAGVPSNITQIAISRTPDFTNISWQPLDKDKFKNIDQTTETLYVKFRTDQGAVSDVITYAPQVANQNTAVTLNDGDIVKTPNNPDVYVIKYKNNKQYKRLILSPLVFKSYRHLKWEDIKIVSQEQLDQYTTSSLVKETIDTVIYQLFPNGDTGERKEQDASTNYDPDSVYEINVTDRDSYKLVK